MKREFSDKEFNKIRNKVKKWYAEFSKSKYFDELTEGQKEEAEFIISLFAEFMYSYHLLFPEEWNKEALEDCCLYIFPRKVTGDDIVFESISPVLATFFLFLSENNILNISKLINPVKRIHKQIVKNAKDPQYWGIGKTFAMAAEAQGFDINNEKDMQKFALLYNLRQAAKLEKRKGKIDSKIDSEPKTKQYKVGRNDPCPCGSGKKYKHCCGRLDVH